MIKNIEEIIEQIKTDIKNFTDVSIIGLSGGADSTLVACLCVEALGKENVYGIHMTYGSHDPGISEEEFMQLDLIEFLFEKIL